MSPLSPGGARIVAALCCLALAGCAADPLPAPGAAFSDGRQMTVSAEGTRGSEPARNPEPTVDAPSWAEGQPAAWSLPPVHGRPWVLAVRGEPVPGFGALPERPPR